MSSLLSADFKYFQLDIDQDNFEPKSMESLNCPKCGRIVEKIKGKQFGLCFNCGSYVYMFEMLPHQELSFKIDARVKEIVGGVGSAKTVGNACQVAIYLLENQHYVVAAMAKTIQQLGAIKLELIQFIPDEFFVVKNDKVWQLDNGSRIEWRPADAESLRSLNANIVWLVEASGIDKTVYEQSLARIRSTQGATIQKDEYGNDIFIINSFGHKQRLSNQGNNHIIIESNPAIGSFIYNDILLKTNTLITTSTVSKNGNVEKYAKLVKPQGDDLPKLTIISSSFDNPFTDEAYKRSLLKAWNTEQLIRTNIYGDMSFFGETVFHFSEKLIVDDFFIPLDWPIFQVLDPAIKGDPNFSIWVAYDKVNFVFYVVASSELKGEYFEDNKLYWIRQEQQITRSSDRIATRRFIDPSAGNNYLSLKSNEKKYESVIEYYKAIGLYFEPVVERKSQLYGIGVSLENLNRLFREGKYIKFFRRGANDLINLIDTTSYNFDKIMEKGGEITKAISNGDYPIYPIKNMHGFDTLRYMGIVIDKVINGFIDLTINSFGEPFLTKEQLYTIEVDEKSKKLLGIDEYGQPIYYYPNIIRINNAMASYKKDIYGNIIVGPHAPPPPKRKWKI